MTERLCVKCKHYDNGICLALNGRQSPVDGRSMNERCGIEAGVMRLTLCGWLDPKLWEPKK